MKTAPVENVIIPASLGGRDIRDQPSNSKSNPPEQPIDLDALYAHVLGKVGPRLSCQGSKIFQVFQHWQSYQKKRDVLREYFPNICSTNLSFAFEDDQSHHLIASNNPLSASEICERRDKVGSWLENCCGGLIEFCSEDLTLTKKDSHDVGTPESVNSGNRRIQYAHDSVLQYLTKLEIWSEIVKKNTDEDFTVEHAVLKSLVLQIKTWTSPAGRREIGCPWDLILSTLRYASYAEQKLGRAQTTLLDELDKSVSEHFHQRVQAKPQPRYNGRPLFPDSHWSEFWPTDFQRSLRWRDTFLALAIRHNLHHYAAAKLASHGAAAAATVATAITQKPGRPLLSYTFFPVLGNFLVDPALVALLLAHGADPNAPFDNSSPWQDFLRYLMENSYQATAKAHTKRASDIAELLLAHGADPHAECDFFQISEDIPRVCSAIDVVQRVFMDEAAEVRVGLQLQRVLLQRQQTVSNAQETLRRIQREKSGEDVGRDERLAQFESGLEEGGKKPEERPVATKSRWRLFPRKLSAVR
ncbi:uncharacterized protein BDZ99DRAFT_525126 [Mytilinidion resinicola]|uniref:DUF7791 domain-containing protein n=1 Tax=Mytilinidion resinicola TaxID=574789 RepID=A0A6A6Y7F4_9PEZI|nr:uncharacterized protein BDZ99DRAFT_525126 [Mytilinidion resinicola]KAF2804771.1 hypothetical protein BDZ99DRAFT_525126 [Mytilinidion resinicola]